jgi:hypothetical protein
MSGDELSPGEYRAIRGVDALLHATRAWLTAADVEKHQVRAAVGRAIGGMLSAGFVGGVAVELGPYAWSAAGAVLALSVWVAGAPAAEVEEDIDGMGPAEFLELLHDLSAGRNLHLSAVREQLVEETGRDWTAQDVTALCRAAGVPTRPGVRVPGADPAVTTGIHRVDLPPLPHPTSGTPVGVVGAGQHPNTNTNKAEAHEVSEGVVIVTTGPSIRQEARR